MLGAKDGRLRAPPAPVGVDQHRHGQSEALSAPVSCPQWGGRVHWTPAAQASVERLLKHGAGGWPGLPSDPATMLLVMVVSETPSGTPVVEMTREEYATYLDREARHATGLSAAEFRRAYLAGKLNESDPTVSDLVGLLRIGQNGHAA